MSNADLSLGIIVVTDSTCKIGGRSWAGIPTLVWPEGIDEDVSDWLRSVVVDSGISLGSAREYAKVVRPFFRFCRERGRSWQSVDDSFLIIWREYQIRTRNISLTRVNTSLNIIFSFYRWAEETKRLRFHVGIYQQNELPDSVAGTTFLITAKQIHTKHRSGRVHRSWATPLTVSNPNRNIHNRHTPTEQEIRRLHEIAADRLNGERDSLMLSWAEEAGPRRSEFMQLCKSHLPTNRQLDELIESDGVWSIRIVRKGGKLSHLKATPELLIRTLDYIEFSRREVVADCKKRIPRYREPDEIFLSSRTGLALHLDSVTSIGRGIFSKAAVERANFHRLRARYAVRTIETLVDAIFDERNVGSESNWVETILTKAAESMGHSHPASLRPYLTYVLNRRIQISDTTKAEKLAARLRQLSLQESFLQRRLQHYSALHRASELLQAGRDAEAAEILRKVADQLE